MNFTIIKLSVIIFLFVLAYVIFYFQNIVKEQHYQILLLHKNLEDYEPEESSFRDRITTIEKYTEGGDDTNMFINSISFGTVLENYRNTYLIIQERIFLTINMNVSITTTGIKIYNIYEPPLPVLGQTYLYKQITITDTDIKTQVVPSFIEIKPITSENAISCKVDLPVGNYNITLSLLWKEIE